MKQEEILKQLSVQKILPLFYHQDQQVTFNIVQALYEAGIRSIEYTNRGAHALGNFTAMKKEAAGRWPGLQLGIGTIKTPEQAQQFIDAGADYIICPTVNPEVAATVHKAGLLWIPGCMTPTEIVIAEQAGARLVKLFPGNLLGPGYVNAIKELFPGLMFMPTGGVEVKTENLESWFRSGVVAVGMGSKLLTKELIEQGDFNMMRQQVTEAMKLAGEAGQNIKLDQ